MGHALTSEQAANRTLFYLQDEHDHEAGGSTLLGFWIYLMSDCLIFAVLFATYGVLGGNYAAGPAPRDLFDLSLVALNTAMLLFSSITGESVEPIRRYYGEDFLVDETLWHGRVEDGRPFLCDGKSGPVSFRLLHVFEISDGKIAREQVWCDLAAIQAQLGVGACDAVAA